jgi:uncharacterized HhH-GPD family protein
VKVELVGRTDLAPFDFRWPEGREYFESGWDLDVLANGAAFRVRIGVGGREVYGRQRVHLVTWVGGQPMVEGVEADDFASSRALLSVLRVDGRRHVRHEGEIPAGYESFDVVRHDVEIVAPYSPRSLAVKLRVGDVVGWATHAIIRARSKRPAGQVEGGARRASAGSRTSWVAPSTTGPRSGGPSPSPAAAIAAAPAAVPDGKAIVRSLLAHGDRIASTDPIADGLFVPGNPEANRLVVENPFAFLLAVIFDQGIKAERAWAGPWELQARLGHLDPRRLRLDLPAVRQAVQRPPKLHRFVEVMPVWVVLAAERVVTSYGGNAGLIWNGNPTAIELQHRFAEFTGIGQKKAAMAVEILARDLHQPVAALAGSDIAYDVHVRRVLLRTGIAQLDDLAHMLAVTRAANPERPGAIDFPAWDVGRRWCHPHGPACDQAGQSCPIAPACPRLIDRARSVHGI